MTLQNIPNGLDDKNIYWISTFNFMTVLAGAADVEEDKDLVVRGVAAVAAAPLVVLAVESVAAIARNAETVDPMPLTVNAVLEKGATEQKDVTIMMLR